MSISPPEPGKRLRENPKDAVCRCKRACEYGFRLKKREDIAIFSL
jgi:hypothetical protein